MSDFNKAYLTIQWTDNGEKKYTNERAIDLGGIGENGCFHAEKRMGTYRARKYKIVFSHNVPIVVVGAEETVEAMPW